MRHNLAELMKRFRSLGIDQQIDYDKFYLYSIITHSTAIEDSTIIEIENRLLFDEGTIATSALSNQKSDQKNLDAILSNPRVTIKEITGLSEGGVKKVFAKAN